MQQQTSVSLVDTYLDDAANDEAYVKPSVLKRARSKHPTGFGERQQNKAYKRRYEPRELKPENTFTRRDLEAELATLNDEDNNSEFALQYEPCPHLPRELRAYQDKRGQEKVDGIIRELRSFY